MAGVLWRVGMGRKSSEKVQRTVTGVDVFGHDESRYVYICRAFSDFVRALLPMRCCIG